MLSRKVNSILHNDLVWISYNVYVHLHSLSVLYPSFGAWRNLKCYILVVYLRSMIKFCFERRDLGRKRIATNYISWGPSLMSQRRKKCLYAYFSALFIHSLPPLDFSWKHPINNKRIHLILKKKIREIKCFICMCTINCSYDILYIMFQ